jgi:hypothetical protein
LEKEKSKKHPKKHMRGEKSMRKIALLASALGIFAGLGGGVLHGIGEVLQGSVAPNGTLIEAWPALQVVVGEPAMTLVLNFLLTGILAIIMGIIVTMWAGKFIQHKSGGLILILLSIVMLLVGGGLIPPFFGIAGGVIAPLNHQTTKIEVLLHGKIREPC